MEGDVTFFDKLHSEEISIHSLRMEGDSVFTRFSNSGEISIHSLRMEGDLSRFSHSSAEIVFQSTPSVWRETAPLRSIFPFSKHFNPLPPYGGRQNGKGQCFLGCKFQSTPSVWRETNTSLLVRSVPPFQSTPSVWRETRIIEIFHAPKFISIHSLRMEGDVGTKTYIRSVGISIHSLRMEGDVYAMPSHSQHWTFQSTPSVWRETSRTIWIFSPTAFQSTPSVWRETHLPQNLRL